ncbi:hypothetical protein QAD02_008237 [Eretmocerus hayati]|uniref:Uncharacterized protein n=1 Tax=Eretmocerus hayati TaxID=131215 RepID=A0ACC2N5X1_9HYME|nr:hypothetical protein QAD02_008237 [Eretmocerus hayati]
MNPILWMEEAVRDFYAHIISLTREDDLIGVSIQSDHFSHGPAGISLGPVIHFRYDDFWNFISGLAESIENFVINESFVLEISFVEVPMGSGRKRKTFNIDAINQRSIISKASSDDCRLPRALVVEEASLRKQENDSEAMEDLWDAIQDWRRPAQRNAATNPEERVGVNIPECGCGYRWIQQFQAYYTQRGIVIRVFARGTLGSGEPFFFDGLKSIEEGVPSRGCINLSYDPFNRHYDTISNLIGAGSSRFYCKKCDKCYKFIDQYLCSAR